MAYGVNIKVTNEFADGTSKAVTIGEIAPTAINETKIRNQVAKLNNATQREEDYPGFTTGFVSNAGANFVSISGVDIITTETIVIF